MNDSYTILAVFEYSTEANLVKAKLDSENIKSMLMDEKTVDSFRINDRNIGAYLVFLEPSTRTEHSFKNASEFHNIKVTTFNADSSSFKNKAESISDSILNLQQYNNSIFSIVSWLNFLKIHFY